jgi:hypothetical protein
VRQPDAIGNALADYAVIVYNEDGSINRESFGRILSPLERALCDALDKREAAMQEALNWLAAKNATGQLRKVG